MARQTTLPSRNHEQNLKILNLLKLISAFLGHPDISIHLYFHSEEHRSSIPVSTDNSSQDLPWFPSPDPSAHEPKRKKKGEVLGLYYTDRSKVNKTQFVKLMSVSYLLPSRSCTSKLLRLHQHKYWGIGPSFPTTQAWAATASNVNLCSGSAYDRLAF